MRRRPGHRATRLAVLGGLAAWLPCSAAAQAPAPTPTAAPVAPAMARPLNWAASLRSRLEAWDWYETGAADDNHAFGAAVLRASIGGQTDRVEWKIEGAFPLLINLPEDAVAAAPQGQLGGGASYFAASGGQDGSAVPKQVFLRWKGPGGDRAGSLRIGRFEFSDGAEASPADATLAALKRERIEQRLLGPFGFSHVGRSYDGVHYARTGRTNVSVLLARPTEGVFQLNGLEELDYDLAYGALTWSPGGGRWTHDLRALALYSRDRRDVLKVDNRPLAERQADGDDIAVTTLGGHWLGAFAAGAGTIDFLAWGVTQSGDWGGLDHRAAAIATEIGWQWTGERAARLRPWVRAGWFHGSGDDDPLDSDHETFFQVLPTPRIYARFPIYNLMNNEDLFLELRFRPHARVGIRADIHRLELARPEDLWYSGGGAFQEESFGYTGRPSGGTDDFGRVYDLSVDTRLTEKATFTAYAAWSAGGEVQASIYPETGGSPRARFVYLELLLRF